MLTQPGDEIWSFLLDIFRHAVSTDSFLQIDEAHQSLVEDVMINDWKPHWGKTCTGCTLSRGNCGHAREPPALCALPPSDSRFRFRPGLGLRVTV